MKKRLSIFFIIVFALFFDGCSDNDNGKNKNDKGENHGVVVTGENLLDFMDSLFVAVSGKSLRSAEPINNTEYGHVKGRVKTSGTSIVNDTTYDVDTSVKTVYSDYSNGGDLYLDGSVNLVFKHIISPYSWEYKINGTIDFNGSFLGCIIYRDISVKYSLGRSLNEEIEIISGSIVVLSDENEMDITDYYGDFEGVFGCLFI